MTKKQICEMFTKKVAEYMSNGYIISPESFSGSDGTSRVDFVKDTHFIRIYMKEMYEHGGDILHFVVCEKQMTSREAKRIYDEDIIWTHELNVIEEYQFWIFNRYHKNAWYVTEEEYREICERTKDRRANRSYDFGYKTVKLPEKAKDIVLPFIQKQPRCKSVKIKDIAWVRKYINSGKIYYQVSCKDKIHTLH